MIFHEISSLVTRSIIHPNRRPSLARMTIYSTRFASSGLSRHSFRFPKLKGNILVVGDGDFGYSVALAKELAEMNRESTARLTASSLDSKDAVKDKYSKGEKNLNWLATCSNASTSHGVDATRPGNLFSNNLWDSIIWNFPYPSSVSRASSGEGRLLLTTFLQNTRQSLKPDGSTYITFFSTQATEEQWNLKAIVCNSGYVIANLMSFDPSKIDGYEPKRAYNDKGIPRGTYSTYRLCKSRKIPDRIAPDIRRRDELRSQESKCTTKEILDLLQRNGEFRLDKLRDLYQETFRKRISCGKGKLRNQIEDLSFDDKRIGIELRGSGWYIFRTTNNKGRKSKRKSEVENISKLLQENKGKLRLSQLKDLYQQRFAKPLIYRRKRLKQRLEELTGSAKCFKVELRGDWWIVRNK